VFAGIWVRVGLLLVVTGLTFIMFGWLGLVGPLLLIIGSGCAAMAFESQLAAAEAAAADPAAAVEPAMSGEHTLPVVNTGGTNQAA
jgi:hypothetical protein